MKKTLVYIVLNVLFLLYSVCGIISKLSAKEELFSLFFFIWYGLELCIIIVYSLLWQVILKKIPLNTAYSNKAILVVYGVLWGVILFNETVNIVQIIALFIIILGVIITVTGGEKHGE